VKKMEHWSCEATLKHLYTIIDQITSTYSLQQ